MDKKRLICTIGGGTGMPVVNEALVKAGYSNIHSIVTTFDNGGDTGRMRTDERGMFLANSDFWRALISLWNDGSQKEIWMEMLRYRDGRERSFGNTFFQFMTEKTGSLDKVDNLFKSLTLADLKGRVIPVSLSPANLYFETISGKKYSGEKFLDQLRMSCDYIKKIWLEPRVKAHPEAIKTLENAEMLIVCPGSVYGSLMVNFLIDDFKKSFQKSHAKKILPNLNIVSDMYECLKDAECLVITTAWKQFKEADLEKVKSYLKSPNIVDGRNLFDQKKMKELGFNYVSVGR